MLQWLLQRLLWRISWVAGVAEREGDRGEIVREVRIIIKINVISHS